MAKEPIYALAAAAPAAQGWSAAASTDERARRDQLALVRILTEDSEPNACMREMADEYRRGVAEGRITSRR